MSKFNSHRRMVTSRRSLARPRGVSLIELMVALVISLVLIGGAIQVYLYSRENYEANEGIAQLQETARYALSIIEPDVRMANAWGLLKGSSFVDVLDVDSNCGLSFAPDKTPAILTDDVLAALAGSNNQYTFGCAPPAGGPMPSSDTLVVQRASLVPSTATAGRLLVCSTRTLARLLNDSTNIDTCPKDPIGVSQVNDLLANVYYINRDSEHRAGLPSLHRWGLGVGNQMSDVEIVPGVEDLQIQFGIDPKGNTGVAKRYINPGQLQAGEQVVSVRVWLLVRSETREQTLTTQPLYEYGDRDDINGETNDLTAAGAATRAYRPADNFRRLLVSRTITVRNAMGI